MHIFNNVKHHKMEYPTIELWYPLEFLNPHDQFSFILLIIKRSLNISCSMGQSVYVTLPTT